MPESVQEKVRARARGENHRKGHTIKIQKFKNIHTRRKILDNSEREKKAQTNNCEEEKEHHVAEATTDWNELNF